MSDLLAELKNLADCCCDPWLLREAPDNATIMQRLRYLDHKAIAAARQGVDLNNLAAHKRISELEAELKQERRDFREAWKQREELRAKLEAISELTDSCTADQRWSGKPCRSCAVQEIIKEQFSDLEYDNKRLKGERLAFATEAEELRAKLDAVKAWYEEKDKSFYALYFILYPEAKGLEEQDK